MKILNTDGTIDQRGTMYPSKAEKVTNHHLTIDPFSTCFGYVIQGHLTTPQDWVVAEKQYFSITNTNTADLLVPVTGTAVGFTRLGFIGQTSVGGPIEESGRLCYIDGCSDSLLIYPPRLGDPSLNLLCFPPNVEQTFHIHPSIRLGLVVEGRGISWVGNNIQNNLRAGDLFLIEQRELHRFSTVDDTMKVIAFHPDGDWGPTDQNHTMLNRTYINK